MDSVEKRISERLGFNVDEDGDVLDADGCILENWTEVIQALWDALLASERSREWIKVTPDTMPKDREWVFVCGGEASYCQKAYHSHGKWWDDGSVAADPLGDITHWQPLPPVPSEEESNGA